MSMNREAMTAFLIDLECAFDAKHAPGGLPFWAELKRRVTIYRDCILPNRTIRLSEKMSAFALPTLPIALFPTFKPEYAISLHHLSTEGFTWSVMPEGETFWTNLHNWFGCLCRFNTVPPKERNLNYETAGDFLTCNMENTQLARMGLKRAFLDLWYKPGLYPHAAPDDVTMVRYVPKNKAPAVRNFVTAKPGKFLKTYFGDKLTDPEIADLAAKFRAENAPPTLKLARTGDEIAHVYANGPESCMSAGKKIDGIEPVRAYASPDLAVAYIERHGSITARTVVYPDKHVHGRIYGDDAAMRVALKDAGYLHDAYTCKRDADASTQRANRAMFNGARLVLLKSKTFRPAKLSLEESGEPVAITPYWDLGHDAYHNPEDGFLYITNEAIPAGRTTHYLKGGNSIHGIPKGKPIPHGRVDRGYIDATLGHNGNNQHATISFTAAGRINPEVEARNALIAAQVAAANQRAAELLAARDRITPPPAALSPSP